MVNVYGPDRDSQLSSFYQNLLKHILEKSFDTIDNIIMGSDFNCPLNPIVDKRGGNLIPRQSVINSIDYLYIYIFLIGSNNYNNYKETYTKKDRHYRE